MAGQVAAASATAPVADGSAARPVSKTTLAYDFIRDRIDDGRYSPGYRLVLGAIAGELGTSSVPVREAIRRLEAQGLVTFEHNVGAQVAMIDSTEFLHTMQTLGLVEGFATALSVPTIDADAIRRARAINEKMAETLTSFDPVSFTRLNREFHLVLFETCPNPHVLDLVHRGWNRLTALRESTFSFVPGRAAASVREHALILDMIEAGEDVSAIESVARDHRLATLNAFLSYQHEHDTPPPAGATRANPEPGTTSGGGPTPTSAASF